MYKIDQDRLPGDPTREKLKTEALRLFSERGIDGVSVRDIVSAAGLRNSSSINYYFGSKEGLVRELLVDIAKFTNDQRNQMLDALEKAGEPISVASVVRVVVETSLDPDYAEFPGTPQRFMRFIMALQLNHRKVFYDALENRWNSAFLRCLDHLRRLLPEVPAEILNQRFVFMSLYVGVTLAAREGSIERGAASRRLWGTPFALENLIDTICGMLEKPPSIQTLDALEP